MFGNMAEIRIFVRMLSYIDICHTVANAPRITDEILLLMIKAVKCFSLVFILLKNKQFNNYVTPEIFHFVTEIFRMIT